MVAHELLVKSGMYLGKTNPPVGTTPVDLLRHHLRNVFSKNEHTEDSLNFLQRFGTRFRIFPITFPLRALHAQHCSAYPDEKLHRRASYGLCAHGPRNFEYGHTVEANERYLNRCLAAFPDSVAIRFFHALSRGTPGSDVLGCDTVPQIRRHFFGGLAAARLRSYSDAMIRLKDFLALQGPGHTNPLSPFGIEEARRVLVDAYRLRGEVVEMQRVVVQAFIDRAQSARRLPVRQVFQACMENVAEAARHIEFPILSYLACDEPHDVCLSLKRFMKAAGVDQPLQLTAQGSLEVRSLAVLLLRVCTPEVLDSLISLDSVERVEAERLSILDWITKNAPTFARVAETEVLRLTQHAQLREALQRIEGPRVVLNLSGLRETEQERFINAYLTMKVLLVEDLEGKAAQVEATLRRSVVLNGLTIHKAKSFISAVRKLQTTAYDLLVLDLVLPMRDGELPTAQGGKIVLSELVSGTDCRRPSHIICLTAFGDQAGLLNEEAEKNLVHVVIYSETEPKWREALVEAKAKYVEKRLRDAVVLPEDYATDLGIITSSPMVELKEVQRLTKAFVGEHHQTDALDYYTANWSRGMDGNCRLWPVQRRAWG